MGPFYHEAKDKLKQLQADFTSTNESIVDLAKFYGLKVKMSQFKVEEFFGIFNEFRLEFIESRDKILKVEAEKEKERRKVEAKRKRAEEMEALKERKRMKKEQ